MFSVPIKLWCDDVSGNKSKQWNKHYNWCWTHGGLPLELQNQEYFIRFLTTSPYAKSLEQAQIISQIICESMTEGRIAYDSELR